MEGGKVMREGRRTRTGTGMETGTGTETERRGGGKSSKIRQIVVEAG